MTQGSITLIDMVVVLCYNEKANVWQEKEDVIMNIKIIEYIIKVVKNVTELCNKIIDASDPEKFAEGVKLLDQGVEDTYAKMQELIMQDNTLSTEEKLEKLEKIAASQQSARKACEDAIKENREHVAKVVTEVFVALTTCGISCIPKVVQGCKKAWTDMPEIVMIESENPIDCIEAAEDDVK